MVVVLRAAQGKGDWRGLTIRCRFGSALELATHLVKYLWKLSYIWVLVYFLASVASANDQTVGLLGRRYCHRIYYKFWLQDTICINFGCNAVLQVIIHHVEFFCQRFVSKGDSDIGYIGFSYICRNSVSRSPVKCINLPLPAGPGCR